MKKKFALVSLSLGIAIFSPVISVFAQSSLPTRAPIVIPSQPRRLPTRLPLPEAPSKPEVLPVLKPMNLGFECRPRHACLGWDSQLFSDNYKGRGDKWTLIKSIDNSLWYLTTNTARKKYANYPVKGITLERVRRSLVRFRQLVLKSKSASALQNAVRREFMFYKSVGNDNKGRVKFTAYYRPIYKASRKRTSVYKYPIYSVPSDFKQWPEPHPKRLELEGKDGLLGNKSRLKGLELFWFRDRLDAYMIHIQGSAQLKFTDGTTTNIGYAGATSYPWTSIGKELIKDGRLARNKATMPGILNHLRRNPQDMDEYLPRWERFVFFRDKGKVTPTGSIGVPVSAERSIATDKSLMPPGALAVVNASFPYATRNGGLQYRRVSRFVLDQDTGSAIKGPGRVDYYMGSGKLAGDRAGITGGNGSLYYMLLKK
ncbi:MAG: murein transglycosylase A [Cyanobacteria bacterium P01_A01_bin.45]